MARKELREGSKLGRREFVRAGLVGGLAAATLTNSGLKEAAAALLASEPQGGKFDWEELTVRDAQAAMQSGRVTARRLTEMYLERIERIDRRGPALNSVIETNPDALSIAEALDRERKAGRVRGPLHGVPVLIKDNIDTADRMMTTAGSLALVGARPRRDAFIVERLRAAGCVILGKTNLSEWANFRSTHSTSGWSGRGGQTRNPYALDRNPCGSSSGSGAAVSANLALLGVGTETDGSIVCPSGTCGIVGIKPTLGLVSRSGIIPISHSQDTAGPMARTVADAAALLEVLAAPDPADRVAGNGTTIVVWPLGSAARTARPGPGTVVVVWPRSLAQSLDPAGLRGARIGVARKFFGFNDAVDKLMAEAIDVLKREGATIVDPADLPTHGKLDAPEFEVLLFEFKADLNKYLAGLAPGDHPRTLKDLIEFNEKNRDREMPFFGQEIFTRAEAKGPLTDPAYLKALRSSKSLAQAQGIDAVMTKHNLDALVAPTGGPAWTTDLLNGDHFTGGSSTPAAVAGYPNVQVPAGYVYGLPVGISFFGRAFTESKLIRLAYAYEQATKHRQPPRLLPSAELKG
ncbi:MAG TPA: amidase family protein [Pyrinomonadaceae bacterium]|nr:amidase family protein [Pyrinomonadaceae bacterium]